MDEQRLCTACLQPEPNALSPATESKKDAEKLAAFHQGSCTSPRARTCPCQKSCPLHGRCCDCVRFHMNGCRKQMEQDNNIGQDWLPACFKLALQGRFDGLDD